MLRDIHSLLSNNNNRNNNSSSSSTSSSAVLAPGTRATLLSKQQQQQHHLDTRLPSSLPPPHATAASMQQPLAIARGSSSGSSGSGSGSGSGASGIDIITPYLPPRPITLRLLSILCSPFLTPCELNVNEDGKEEGRVVEEVEDVDSKTGGSSQADQRVSQKQQHTLSSLITVLLSAWLRLLKVCNTSYELVLSLRPNILIQ